jgi:SAM-dependent methyltransferase
MSAVSCASERRSLEFASTLLPQAREHARAVLDRVRAVHDLPEGAAILDIGAAQGLFAVACAELGYRCVGVEPWTQAREVAGSIARSAGFDIEMLDGVAESLPVPAETFDFVHAMSVVEHVESVERTFAEIYRVLRPGGVFWFSTASSMCPMQNEIRGFPAFGWYPDPVKRAVMDWAIRARPDLIAHTTRPAYHWFTPRKAARLLRDAGFTRVLDRWELRQPAEGGRHYRCLLAAVKASSLIRTIADVCVPTCSYAAFK